MDVSLLSFVLGGGAALLIGIAKTGVPGAAIPAVAMMAEAFPQATKLSVGALLPILIVGDLFAIRYYRRHAQWDRLAELFPYVVAGMVPGYLVLWLTESDSLRVLIGAIVLVLLALHAARWRFGWEKMPDRWWFIATTGVLAGFGTTVGNAAGPVMSIYLVSKRLDKYDFLGTSAWFFFIVNLSKIPLYLTLGMITPTTAGFGLTLVPVMAVGAFAGLMLLKRIPQAAFNAIVLGLAGVAAVRLVLF